MGILNDDIVLIHEGKKSGEPHTITVNCPDKTGLACDICRIILEFGLCITKGDVSTDGNWCYFVFWVRPHYCSQIKWSNLTSRILSACPPFSIYSYLYQKPTQSVSSPLYLLKFFCLDRRGLLHDVTHVLSELEFTIQKVKVTTTPDGRVLDLFFITDNMELLHTKDRRDETYEQFRTVLGESCISCELQLVGPEYECSRGMFSLPSAVVEELFHCDLSDKGTHSQPLSPHVSVLKCATITVDNLMSPSHTLLQVHCFDHKGLLYDTMRTLKDYNMKISYGRFWACCNSYRDLDLFVQQKDGKKITDVVAQADLCSRLKMEMLHPLRVVITDRGPDTELLVANPVELCGNGRPRVFYDVTLALKTLEICIFSAEIGRYSTLAREWEVYRFLLEDKWKIKLSTMVARNQIVDKVRRSLMGW